MSPSVHTYPDTAALVAAVGDRLAEEIGSVISFRGRAMIVLTGGGTGIGLLKRLGERGDAIDWSRVHVFWGDERYVPEDDDERNDKQAREALIDKVDIPSTLKRSTARRRTATRSGADEDVNSAARSRTVGAGLASARFVASFERRPTLPR